MSTFYKLSIKEIIRETEEAISVVFNVPEELKKHYEFKAGQYVNLKLTLDGEELRRAYSICTPPSSGQLKITIKAMTGGKFSVFANKQLQVGHVLEVGLPEGKFTIEPDSTRQRNYMAIAAGSGITPVLSIIESILTQETSSSFVLIYGNKSPEKTIFFDYLNDLQSKYLGQFYVHYNFTNASLEGALFGRIDKSSINFYLKNKHKEKEFNKFFLCGPEDLINTATEVLKENNIAEKDIKFELFATAPSTSEGIETGSGHSKLTIILDDEETTIEISQKQTILEAALKQGLDAPYSCQGGICSSCIARIKSGTATMRKNQILSDEEIEEGLILTCQAHATSSEITLDYDDV